MSKINVAHALGIAGAQASVSDKNSAQSIGRAASYAQNQQTPKLSELDRELLELKTAITSLETQADCLLDKLQPVISDQVNRGKEDNGEVMAQQETTSLLTRELRILTDKVQYLTRVLDVNTIL